MECPDENALLELADGLLGVDRQREIARHVEGCGACRAVLAGLAGTRTNPAPLARAAPGEDLPKQLLREFLKRDAPHREELAVRFLVLLELVGVAISLGMSVTGGAARWSMTVVLVVGQLAPMPAQLWMMRALRRGWFRPWVPFVNAAIEISLPFLVVLSVGRGVGPSAALVTATQVIWGAAVMFSALRASPGICLGVGALAAVESLVLFALYGPHVHPTAETQTLFGPAGAVLRFIFFLLAGAGGAVLARLQVRGAEDALRALRMQDLMGKYVLHEPLGRGGMAEVNRATYCPEGGFSKLVAVKRVLPALAEDERFIEAFREEARLGALLAHPNVVQVLDFGRFRDSYALVLEFVDGVTLQRLLQGRSGPLPVSAAVYLGVELAKALEYIHSRRAGDGTWLELVHRDLNPPNVLVSRIGEVKLGDFGVASAASRQAVRAEGEFAGKETWAAPEQLRGERLDGRADLYTLALTLAEALAHGQPGTERLRGLERPDVPPALRSLLESMLSEVRGERPASGEEVRQRLMSLEGDAAALPAGPEVLAHAVRALEGPRP